MRKIEVKLIMSTFIATLLEGCNQKKEHQWHKHNNVKTLINLPIEYKTSDGSTLDINTSKRFIDDR